MPVNALFPTNFPTQFPPMPVKLTPSDEEEEDNPEVKYDPEVTLFFREDTTRRRFPRQFTPDENKDEKYFERRRRNNLAAQRCRKARKDRFNQMAARRENSFNPGTANTEYCTVVPR